MGVTVKSFLKYSTWGVVSALGLYVGGFLIEVKEALRG